MRRILIDVHPNSTKVCIANNGLLEEFWVERKNLSRLVGNVYKGKVENVLPGMQAAFVNIGLQRNAFLYAGDVVVDGEQVSADKTLDLREGDTVLCQVEKDEFGNKGARISMNITIPGRVVILMPRLDYVGVSRKITDDETRRRLIAIANEIRPEGCGVIMRTQAEHCSEAELRAEMKWLVSTWNKIKEDELRKPAGSLIYKERDLAVRAVRDMLVDVDEIVINNRKVYDEFCTNLVYITEEHPGIFKYYNSNKNILAAYGLTEQIDALLRRKVPLRNGAYLIIDRTEALTVIDVNTGRYVGTKNLEETVFDTNKIAAVEIARQIRLRNIGGIIVIDFIDMENRKHRERVLEALQAELDKDRIKTTLVGLTGLGLVELTRKKTRSMIESVMLQPCPYCRGDGYVYSDEHMIMKIRTAVTQAFEGSSAKAAKVTVAPSVFNKLFSLRYLENECRNEWKDKRIYVVPDERMHIEKYKLETLNSAVLDLPDNARLLY